MSRIDVAFGATHRLRQAAQTAYKHFLAGHSVLIYCTDEKRLAAFDTCLWEVEKTSFVPHPFVEDEGLNSLIYLCRTPPHLFVERLTLNHVKPYLLNLDIHCPPHAEAFDRILEIVSTHEEDKRLARERIHAYKQAQHDIIYHTLTH